MTALVHAEPRATGLTQSVSQPHDRDERQAERAAEVVAGGGSVADWSFAAVPPAAPDRAGWSRSVLLGAEVEAAFATPGRPLDHTTREAMARRFGDDFAGVRIHEGARPAAAAADLGAAAFTVGDDIAFGAGRYQPSSREGRHLLAHELAHVVQQSRAARSGVPARVQRKVIVNGAEIDAKERAAILKRHHWADARLAKAVIDDMADAGDPFDFTDEAELTTEIVKRVATASHMVESQQTVGADHRTAFGYPFSHEAALYGPRVNFAARDLWEPRPPDDFAPRTDKKKNAALSALPRSRRHEVYGDMPPGYSWTLTAAGKKDTFSAITLLFTAQQAHKRTLLHCDYLISIVNFRSLADSVGKDVFNQKIATFGPDKIRLRWNAFQDLHEPVRQHFMVPFVGTITVTKQPGLGSTQSVVPSTERDLVIGDHVVFFNNLAYDLINTGVGNAWRLENAVLVRRDGGVDTFLGHGSGAKTSKEMRDKLAQEFNVVVESAQGLIAKTASKDAKTAGDARKTLQDRSIEQRSDGWWIVGQARLCPSKKVEQKLRKIGAGDVVGLHSPCDPSKLYQVERPVESAKGKP